MRLETNARALHGLTAAVAQCEPGRSRVLTTGHSAAPHYTCTSHCARLFSCVGMFTPQFAALMRTPADQSAPPAPARRPLPIPTFDEFVLLHKAIMAAVSDDPATLGALHGARRSFGWNMLGNLLDLGKIAFAPATPEVLRWASAGWQLVRTQCLRISA